ncbi:MAG: hypothetical protein R2709_10280 [Marmoricola sp.]
MQVWSWQCWPVGGEDLDRRRPSDPAGAPRWHHGADPGHLTWTNEGSEPLRDLGWEDTTFVGPDLTGITCEYAGSPIDQTTVLPVGESVDCVGTLPSMDLGASHEDEFTVTGVGTVSGTPVAASDRWQAVTNGAASWTMSKTSDPASGTEVKPGSGHHLHAAGHQHW